MRPEPRIAAAFRQEFADWRLWWGRVVVVSMAMFAGLVVVLFTHLTEGALETFVELESTWWWAPLMWTPFCTALVVWLTRRYAPGAAGSGIPQVMAALEPKVNHGMRGLFVSVRLTVAKFFLTALGLLGGLSLGREGPSVQIAAGIMLAARRLLPRRAAVTAHGLLVTGGAAGIAAAFNTPLAGVMFAIEELSRTPEQRSSGLLVTGIVLSGLIGISLNGNVTYFGMIRVSEVSLDLVGPALLVALACGLAGGLFSRLLLRSLSNTGNDRFSRFRRQHPVWFAAGCGLVVAVIGAVTQGATFGSGYQHTRHLLEGAESDAHFFVLLKFVATWITTWSGAPAGIFAPSLSIGGALGNDIAQLIDFVDAPTLIALGMVAFLAAVTQAPMTSFIIVMEMVNGHALVLTLMACALIASAISRLLSRPLYASLADLQLLRLPPVPETPAAPADASPLAAGAVVSAPVEQPAEPVTGAVDVPAGTVTPAAETQAAEPSAVKSAEITGTDAPPQGEVKPRPTAG